tara:strand:+ start:4970 stop:5782 length:813 start_codon:yes stop_codon:yes gene_type:complete
MLELNLYYLILFFGLGACIGSFVNASAYRLVRGQDWIFTKSKCFACNKKLTFLQNIPIFGYLRYFGNSKCCVSQIPIRYLLVEFAFAIIFISHLMVFGGYLTVVYLPFICILSIIFLTDMEAFHIPDIASIGGTAIGLIFVIYKFPSLPNTTESLIAGGLGFFTIYFINLIYRILRGKNGIGFGDAKLMLMLGIWMGVENILVILFIASFLGTLIGISYVIYYSKLDISFSAINNKNILELELPFGCFLVCAALIDHFFNVTNHLYNIYL